MISGPIVLGFALLALTVLVLYGWHLYREEQNGKVGDLRVVLRDGMYSIEEKKFSLLQNEDLWLPVGVFYTVEEVERDMPSLEQIKGECTRLHNERRQRDAIEKKRFETRVVHLEKFKKNRHGR